jgi:uncharacterized RDD family membrane protein YckC
MDRHLVAEPRRVDDGAAHGMKHVGEVHVGVIWVAFDSRHQGWHDKIARTLVVRA